jgi:hypothetical protein
MFAEDNILNYYRRQKLSQKTAFFELTGIPPNGPLPCRPGLVYMAKENRLDRGNTFMAGAGVELMSGLFKARTVAIVS